MDRDPLLFLFRLCLERFEKEIVINNPNVLLYFLQMQDYDFLSLFISTDPVPVMK